MSRLLHAQHPHNQFRQSGLSYSLRLAHVLGLTVVLSSTTLLAAAGFEYCTPGGTRISQANQDFVHCRITAILHCTLDQ
jgi:hypothetical protein